MELFNWYLVSIGVYFVVIIALLDIFADKITENGWIDDCDFEDDENPYPRLFLTCAIPLVRFQQLYSVLIMAFRKRDEFEEE